MLPEEGSLYWILKRIVFSLTPDDFPGYLRKMWYSSHTSLALTLTLDDLKMGSSKRKIKLLNNVLRRKGTISG